MVNHEANKTRYNSCLDVNNSSFFITRFSDFTAFRLVDKFHSFFSIRHLFNYRAYSTKNTIKGLVAYILCINANAINIDNYTQEKKGRVKGFVSINQIYGSSVYAEIFVSGKPVDFQIEQTASDEITLIVDDNMKLSSDDYITIAVETSDENKSRIFAANSTINTNKDKNVISKSSYSGSREISNREFNNNNLDGAKLHANEKFDLVYDDDTDTENTLEVNIKGGKEILTTKEVVMSLNLYTGYRLVEMPGDEEILNTFLNKSVQVTNYEDLYLASNGKIGQIFIDDENGLIRIAAHKQVKMPSSIQQETALTPDIANIKVPLKKIIMPLIQKEGYNLVEMPGDERLMLISVDNQILNNFSDIYKITNGKITNGKITNGKITNGKITNGKITNGKITNGKITNIFIDEKNKKIRLSNKPIKVNTTQLIANTKPNVIEENKPIQLSSLEDVLSGYAKRNNYELLIMPGDDIILSRRIESIELENLDKIHELIPDVKLYVDDKNRLIRVKKG